MNVEYFPYDEQSCFMKFGSWTYNGAQVDLKHLDQVWSFQSINVFAANYLVRFKVPGSNIVQIGIDLSEFYLSVEWDVLEVPASRNEEYYPCCAEPWVKHANENYSSIVKNSPADSPTSHSS